MTEELTILIEDMIKANVPAEIIARVVTLCDKKPNASLTLSNANLTLSNAEETPEERRKRQQRERFKRYYEKKKQALESNAKPNASLTLSNASTPSPDKEKSPLNPLKEINPIPPISSKKNPPKGGEKESFSSPSIRKRNEYPEDFKEFWREYPSNTASKVETFPKYKAAIARGATHREIMVGVDWYKRSLELSGQSVMQAYRWLDRERYTVDYKTIIQEYQNGRNIKTGFKGAGAGFNGKSSAEITRSGTREIADEIASGRL